MMTTVLACLSVGVSLVVLGLVNVASSEIIDIDQGSAIEVRLKVKLSPDRYKYVDAIHGKVHLSHRTTGAFTGTRWRLINENNYFTIESLSSEKHRQHRFLQGQAKDGSVVLTSWSSDTSRDTHWAIRGTDRDGYTITWLDSDAANPLLLHADLNNGRTYLAPGEFRWIIVSACSNRYFGPTRTTVSGRTCQAWASQTPHKHTLGSTSEVFPDESISHAQNYCRDPDNSGFLWCYTNDPKQRWEKCDIDACGCVTSTEQRSVKTKTISGRTCMAWASHHPHKHSFQDANFTDGSTAAAGNNCRDPSHDGFLWCYTTDPAVRWERCDEELCVAANAKQKENIWWNASNCGKTKYDAIDQRMARIVGGHNARQHEVPWQVLVKAGVTGMCGGVIISPYWVVTAAHCTFNHDSLLLSASNMQVIVGEHDRAVPNSKRQVHTVKSVHTHHRYSKSTYDYDIALLRLHRPIKFSDDVTAVCAPTSNSATAYINQSLQISGWGHLKYGGETSRVLQMAWVSITSPELCASKYAGIGYSVTKQMVCAGKGNFSQVDTCQGDSGGPLTVRRPDGQFELVGLTSFGYACASSLPGVYTNVPHVKSWISSVIREYQPCGFYLMPFSIT